jgi:hypothetical protein
MLFGETPPPYTTRRRVPSLGSERQSKPTLASGRVAHGVGFQPKTLRNSQLIDIVFPIHPDIWRQRMRCLYNYLIVSHFNGVLSTSQYFFWLDF